jgi:hypothetical protein
LRASSLLVFWSFVDVDFGSLSIDRRLALGRLVPTDGRGVAPGEMHRRPETAGGDPAAGGLS